MNGNIVIAIDGASASGKSTTSKMVARALGFVLVDTGAMYRTLAWHCLKSKIDIHDKHAVEVACANWNATSECVDHALRLVVDGHYPGHELRAAAVTEATPFVAKVAKVREWMKTTQRQCLQFGSLVMEGRDIGTHIFPNAGFKFYLDACPTERARRRAAEGSRENIAARDEHDTKRTAAPLQIAPDALVINNSKMTVAEGAEMILERVRKELTPA